MPLQPGTSFGPYEVIAKIGEGGMGEVYAGNLRPFDLRQPRHRFDPP